MEPRAEPNGRAAAWPEIAFHNASIVRAWACALGCLALSVLGAAVVFGLFPDVERWSKVWLAGWFFLIWFPIGAMPFVRVALIPIPVTVGRQGILDRRESPDWIPWSAITGVSVASNEGRPFLKLQVNPAFARSMSRALLVGRSADGALHISMDDLSVSIEALKAAIDDGLARARGG